MHYQEIMNKEASNIGEINLYLEGVFGKAYQQSAYLFVKNVADFKLSGKFIKAISQPVVSIGFPKSSLIKLFDKNHIEKIDEKSICIKGYKLDLSQYNEWFEKRPVLKEKNNKEVYSGILMRA